MQQYLKSNLNEIQISIKAITALTILYIINIFSVSNEAIGIMISISSYAIILYVFLFRSTLESVLLYLIFLTTSFEVQAFVFGYFEPSNLYGFLIVPYLGIYPMFLLNILFFLRIYFTGDKISFSGFNNLRAVYIWSWIIFLIGIFMLSISILLNDNNILSLHWYFDRLTSELYGAGIIFLSFQIFIGLLLKQPDFFWKLKSTLVHLLVAMIPAAIFTIIFGMHGYYGASDNILLMPLATTYGIGIYLLSEYSFGKKRLLYAILGLAYIVVMFIRTSPLGGKWIILLGFTFILVVLKKVKTKTYISYLSLVVVLLMLGTSLFLLPDIIDSDELFTRKMDQVKSTVMIFRPDWYANMYESPKFRIEEFLNTALEYYEKPLYLIFGKGHGGTVTQHTMTLDWSSPGAFSANEVNTGVFMRLHSSVNIIFLKYGVLGLVFFAKIILICIRGFEKSPWILMGLVWFTLFYMVYSTMLFGAVALIVGIYEYDLANKMKAIHIDRISL